jgi:hypothetical protein
MDWRVGCFRKVCKSSKMASTPRLAQDCPLTARTSPSLSGWVRRRYRYHPLPAELGVRLTPHPAQATGRLFQVSDSTPVDRCSRVTFTLMGLQLFPWMSLLLLVLTTSHPATSAPFQVGHHPIRRVMDSPCLSAVGLRFLAVLSHEGIGAISRWADCRGQTLLGLPRSA